MIQTKLTDHHFIRVAISKEKAKNLMLKRLLEFDEFLGKDGSYFEYFAPAIRQEKEILLK